MLEAGLYLIPSQLSDVPLDRALPVHNIEVVRGIRHFVVESLRSARRFLKKCDRAIDIDALTFHELNEHTPIRQIEGYLPLFDGGHDVGLISEAGLPAVADPGAQLVALCHSADIEVVPFVGPSSLMLALMASGLNGQSFAFRGYLPAKTDERRAAIRAVEKRSAAARETQIFIETPYRNDALLADLLATLSPRTRLTLAADITLPDAFIRTRSVAAWKQSVPVIGKRPCVFLLLA